MSASAANTARPAGTSSGLLDDPARHQNAVDQQPLDACHFDAVAVRARAPAG
jgi:hypothetical protein